MKYSFITALRVVFFVHACYCMVAGLMDWPLSYMAWYGAAAGFASIAVSHRHIEATS